MTDTPVDNQEISRLFEEIAALLEISGANPFKIRAYRNASEMVSTMPERLNALTSDELRAIPGIGKDLAAKIQELTTTGDLAFHRELLESYPASLLDVLSLQGLGPKTVAVLYETLQIATIDDLHDAVTDGRLDGIRGIGPKKQQRILRAIDERRRRHGRYLIGTAQTAADAVIAHLRTTHSDGRFQPVGSLRRGSETCGDVDILAVGVSSDVHERFVAFPETTRVLGQGQTKSSILIRDGLQVDLRVVPPESEGAALQYFTGSKAHNIALRDRALQRELRLNEYGLFQISNDTRVAGSTEQDIYSALGLSFIPAELRENRGEIAAAEERALPALVEAKDIRGDLHCHTTATDGKADIGTMARAARDRGLEYLAITDHSQALAMANGLNEAQTLAHAQHIREIDRSMPGITLLAGIECDILPDGTLDLAEDCLAQLDVVVASVHSAFGQEEAQMTDRVLRAMASPVVDIVGHPTGRLLLRREPYRIDMERLIETAATSGVALEINSQVHRLDVNDAYARLARDRGVNLVISTDAHSPNDLALLHWGTLVARRAWLKPSDILNTLPVEAFRSRLRRAIV